MSPPVRTRASTTWSRCRTSRSTSFPTLTATSTAAEIAKILLQQPFRAFFIGSDLKT